MCINEECVAIVNRELNKISSYDTHVLFNILLAPYMERDSEKTNKKQYTVLYKMPVCLQHK